MKRPLDKRISFEVRSIVRSEAYGTVEDEDWTEAFSVFASVWEVLPGRSETVDGDMGQRRAQWDIEIRWGAAVTGDMRVNFGGRLLRIASGPTEKGRRDRLVLRCENYSAEGLEP